MARQATQSPIKSPRRSLSESRQKSKSRLQGWADTLKSKANYFYVPVPADEIGQSSPQSQLSRKSVRFRSRHSVLETQKVAIDHSSPVDIPQGNAPLLPALNISRITFTAVTTGQEEGPQTARPPMTPILAPTEGDGSLSSVEHFLSDSPAKSLFSNTTNSALPTPMPGTNLPLEDPFEDAGQNTEARQDMTRCSLTPEIVAESGLLLQPASKVQDTELFEDSDNITGKPFYEEDNGYMSDYESAIDVPGITGQSKLNESNDGSMREIAKTDDLFVRKRSTLKRTLRLSRGLRDLSCRGSTQTVAEDVSHNHEADTETSLGIDLANGGKESVTKPGFSLTEMPSLLLETAITGHDTDNSESLLELGRFENSGGSPERGHGGSRIRLWTPFDEPLFRQHVKDRFERGELSTFADRLKTEGFTTTLWKDLDLPETTAPPLGTALPLSPADATLVMERVFCLPSNTHIDVSVELESGFVGNEHSQPSPPIGYAEKATQIPLHPKHKPGSVRVWSGSRSTRSIEISQRAHTGDAGDDPSGFVGDDSRTSRGLHAYVQQASLVCPDEKCDSHDPEFTYVRKDGVFELYCREIPRRSTLSKDHV
ncbi:hypothetical protein UCRPC4_g05592 [Phaeomoniella chlamydospora]|uniref:Uncharacterized protein n=1 Tax=Phaeomoniella chlamydospora TaxID=158046 RepID=A0A0G2GKL6_PHACM|nr:hypothetical protein UCRPC4_g05592 [Phaeomoniella chlamydospora]